MHLEHAYVSVYLGFETEPISYLLMNWDLEGFEKDPVANAVSVLTQQYDKIYLLQLGSLWGKQHT